MGPALLENYTQFRVLLPHASKQYVVGSVEKQTIANLLDVGSAKGYLDNVTIDAFFRPPREPLGFENHIHALKTNRHTQNTVFLKFS